MVLEIHINMNGDAPLSYKLPTQSVPRGKCWLRFSFLFFFVFGWLKFFERMAFQVFVLQSLK